MKYNSKDASSNFFKIIVEFGVLSILLLSLFISFGKKITLK